APAATVCSRPCRVRQPGLRHPGYHPVGHPDGRRATVPGGRPGPGSGCRRATRLGEGPAVLHVRTEAQVLERGQCRAGRPEEIPPGRPRAAGRRTGACMTPIAERLEQLERDIDRAAANRDARGVAGRWRAVLEYFYEINAARPDPEPEAGE